MIVGIVGHVFRQKRIDGAWHDFAGQARAGKDTAAKVLTSEFGFIGRGFADPIREFIASAQGVSVAQIEAQKNTQLHGAQDGVTVRRAMETLGTEWGRGMIGADFWIRWAVRDWSRIERAGADVVVPDVRFHNEIDAIVRAGGKILQIIRLTEPGWDGGADLAHPSNQRLSLFTVPHETIVNDGTLDDFRAKVRAWAEKQDAMRGEE
jgi:hypothetical protein